MMPCHAHQNSGKPCRKSTSGPAPASTTWNRLPLAPTKRWVHGPSTSTHDSSTWALMRDSLGPWSHPNRSARFFGVAGGPATRSAERRDGVGLHRPADATTDSQRRRLDLRPDLIADLERAALGGVDRVLDTVEI